MKIICFLFILICDVTFCDGEDYLISLEEYEQNVYLSSYRFSAQMAHDENLARLSRHELGGFQNSDLKVDFMNLGYEWGGDQVVVLEQNGFEFVVYVYASPLEIKGKLLTRLSQFEIEIPNKFSDIQSFDIQVSDPLLLGYDQLQLVVHSSEGVHYIILVPPISVNGKWRQSQWVELSYEWPFRPQQLISFDHDKFKIYDLTDHKLLDFDSKEGVKEYVKPNNYQKLIGELNDGDLVWFNDNLNKVILEKVGEEDDSTLYLDSIPKVIDLKVMGVKSQGEVDYSPLRLYSLKRYDETGKPMTSWLRDEDTYKLTLEFECLDPIGFERDELSYEIWWDTKSPSVDIDYSKTMPDIRGKWRKPIRIKDLIVFENKMKWPYDKFLRNKKVIFNNRYTVVKFENEKKRLESKKGDPMDLSSF